MVQQNDVIAIIIIVLFIILALIAYGIYHLVSVARRGGSSSGSSSSRVDMTEQERMGWDEEQMYNEAQQGHGQTVVHDHERTYAGILE
ncbi:hypothetical protein HYALB_00007584 [Hymenoscyphus albidus]|uniref:Uncharacterized protein n=1 Tax=Hymenoscyphus albidus TaxID=595503 RepID=A0A9N9LHZ6_9HELO|nr:hypothetical protein HYALB_00007584 [Hymenoscyphus albidus]